MKNFLFILTLLFGMLLFSPQEEVESDNIAVAQKEAVMKEKGSADVQYYLNVLSTDLKESKGLTARRTVQSTKEMNAQRKVLENVSECQTINLSTLLCRMGEHVFALRKLII